MVRRPQFDHLPEGVVIFVPLLLEQEISFKNVESKVKLLKALAALTRMRDRQRAWDSTVAPVVPRARP